MGMISVLLAILLAQVCFGGQFVSYTYQGRNNMLYIPTASGSKPLPVFVMLHGCTQNPTDFAAGTNMNKYGEQYNFFVLYPEQPSSANSNKCWNWFETQHQSRGSGEPALISAMALSIGQKYKVDNSSYFVGGLSAGGAMSDIMGATYPDVFRGVCVGAGLEYKAATSVNSAYTAMSSGGPAPATQGLVAYKAMGKYASTMKVLCVHGTSDYTVYPVNGQQVTSQYAKTLDYVLGNGQSKGIITDTPTTTTPGQVPSGRAYTTYTYADTQSGTTLIQYVTVTSMGHAWSGGSSSGSYTDPKGPDASLMMVQFFLTNSSQPTTSTATSATATTGSATTGGTTSATITSGTSSSTSTTGNKGQEFTSIAGEDGFAGSIPAYGFSTTICKIGDVGGYQRDNYRTILSFDTTTLQGTPSRAWLTITRQSLTGTMTPMIVDIKAGSFGTPLSQMAYYGTPSTSNIGLIGVPSSDGASVSFQLPSSALKYITSTATRTQFMLRQDLNTAPIQSQANNLQIYDGQATLTVIY